MSKRPAVKTKRKPTVREAHNHCEARNDSHVDYCREPGRWVVKAPRGMGGILFVCEAHLDGRPSIPISRGGPVDGGAWGPDQGTEVPILQPKERPWPYTDMQG